MSTTETGRRRQQALFEFLGRYPMATTDQLAALIWGGDTRLARHHLLRFTRDGQLRRLPHPLFRNGAYVYTAESRRATAHSQKVLHHLAEVEFHLAVTRQLGRYGARVIPELPWGPGVVPDQTVLWKDRVWAVEHHLTGAFQHAGDYRRLVEEEGYTLCGWWRPELRIGLLVGTAPAAVEHMRSQLIRADLEGLPWKVILSDSLLRDPAACLK